MAAVRQKGLTLDDTIWAVMNALEERPEISYPVLKEICVRVKGIEDREAFRRRVLELADELYGPEA